MIMQIFNNNRSFVDIITDRKSRKTNTTKKYLLYFDIDIKCDFMENIFIKMINYKVIVNMFLIIRIVNIKQRTERNKQKSKYKL
jgi:hypothetical protein